MNNDTFERMDKMYRRQRYFYDLTRKYYLFGRDRLLAEINPKAGENILEIGCGTGRNLLILARKNPQVNFFGLDASAEMLKTARAGIEKKNIKNINLQTALADDFSFDKTFGLEKPFDVCFFSFSISMIPPWKAAIQNALNNLKPDGSFYIVDFYDQKALPAWFRNILKGWLRQFHVRFWSDLLPYLTDLEKQGAGKFSIESIYKSYSFISRFTKI